MHILRCLTAVLWFGFASQATSAADSRPPGELHEADAITFRVSCSPSVQSEFEHGVALLHSFFYEESRRIFTSIAERDPSCAMAQWGIAQTWWHPIWTPPRPDEFAAGRAAAELAMALPSSPRERAFIIAIATYYATPDAAVIAPVGQSCHGPVGAPARVSAYEREMRKLYQQFPEDFEVRAFHALAVLAVGYAMPTDPTLSKQHEAGEILESLWRQNPHHPGVAHYIIHSYDYPALAERALPAAKAYATIAPRVPHALHMPSHIFTRLGMWDESIATNLASAEASRAYARQRGRTATETEELHALDYLMYSYLQEGRDSDARGVLEQIVRVRETFPAQEFVGAYALGAVPARYALEREAWPEAATVQIPQRQQWAGYPFLEALFEYAHALGRVHTGDLDGARRAIERMRQLRDATTDVKFGYFRQHLFVQIQAASAWLDHAEQRDEQALASMAAAADMEDSLGKHPVTPGALMPVREQLGALLLELKRPQDALAAYQTGLQVYPARFRGLYGAGLAAERAGNPTLARLYFGKLVEQTVTADTARAELSHARAYLEEKIAAR